jgi:phospholipid/cholesterol/gamma-HCH transport system substrate-binding protein
LKISKELKTGIIAIIAITVLIWGYNFLKKQNLFEKELIYYTSFNNVQGLSNSSKVTLNGLQIGNIIDINFDKDKKGSFIVKFNITKNIKFSKNSIAKIIPPTINGMGAAELAIIPDFNGKPAKNGDYLPGQIAPGLMDTLSQKIDPLNKRLNSVLENTDKLLVNLNNTLEPKTQQNIKTAIANLNTTLNHFKNVSKNFDTLLAENKVKFNSILNNAETTSKSLAKITSEMEKENLTKELQSAMANLNKSLKSFDGILAKIDNGEGSIGMLLKDKGLYNNLENASKEMEELLREMKLHPKRFVHFSLFGKKDKGYKTDTTN